MYDRFSDLEYASHAYIIPPGLEGFHAVVIAPAGCRAQNSRSKNGQTLQEDCHEEEYLIMVTMLKKKVSTRSIKCV